MGETIFPINQVMSDNNVSNVPDLFWLCKFSTCQPFAKKCQEERGMHVVLPRVPHDPSYANYILSEMDTLKQNNYITASNKVYIVLYTV